MFLLSHKRSWRLVPMKYEIDMSAPGLLHMIVSSSGDEFEPQRATKTRTTVRNLDEVFDLGDPMEYGRSQASRASGSSAPASSRQGGASADNGVLSALGWEFDFEEVEPDIAADLAEAIAAERQVLGEIAAAMGEAADGEGVPQAQDEDEIGFEDIPTDPAVEDASPVDGIEVVTPPPPPSPEQLADLCEVDDRGQVWCAIPPFSVYRPVGRITTWPESKPLEKRSVSIRCALHPKCNVAKSRSKVTDRELLVWLFSGDALGLGAASAEVAAAGQRHKTLAGQRFC